MRAPLSEKAKEILQDEKAAKNLRRALKDGTEIEVGDRKVRLKKAPRYTPRKK